MNLYKQSYGKGNNLKIFTKHKELEKVYATNHRTE